MLHDQQRHVACRTRCVIESLSYVELAVTEVLRGTGILPIAGHTDLM
jgi:hypothetical protein